MRRGERESPWYRENRGEGIKGARERERQREVEGGGGVLEVVEEGVEI